ncbi:hypothetical protein HUU42_01195 [bacterium]|nr:hypothetical protein [bacterium]
MLKKISIFVCVLIIPSSVWAGGSPFSSGGFGLLNPPTGVRALGMGGVTIAVPSYTTVNFYNPAALYGVNMARFEAGVFTEGTNTRNGISSVNSSTANVNHIAFALPFGKRLAAGIHLSRYSRVGYDFTVIGSTFDGYTYREKFKGDGGIQMIGLTFAGRVYDSLSIGLSTQYLFGSIDRTWKLDWEDENFFDTEDLRDEHVKGGRLVLGALYSKEKFNVGTFIGFKAGLTNDVTDLTVNGDTVGVVSRDMDFPLEFGFGGIYRLNKIYSIGMDFVYTGWKSVQLDEQDLDFRNATKISIGAEKGPDPSISATFLERMTFRAGAYYQTLYSKNASGKYAGEYFFTTGFGLPFNRDRHLLSFAFEIGKRGSVPKNNVREIITRFSLSISGGERWFQNRKRR